MGKVTEGEKPSPSRRKAPRTSSLFLPRPSQTR
nr:MAG TPA: hypothetical protein [Caudoviricetes sp.]